MEVSQKEGAARPRRSKPAPNPDPLESGFPPFIDPYDLEIPRFIGRSAPLATLTAQLTLARRTGDSARTADVLVRLAHHLAKIRIEPALAAEALEEARREGHIDLLTQLVDAWQRAGDAQMAMEYFSAWIAEYGEGATRDGEREAFEFLLRGADLAAHLGDAQQARRALTLAQKASGREPAKRATIYRKLGAIGFWAGDFDVGADAYLLASELEDTLSTSEAPLEDARRAFELAPNRRDVAESVARRLLDLGRSAAADSVRRFSLKHGGAAERATFHRRRFLAALRDQSWAAALGAALEAGLDGELDFARTRDILASPPDLPTDFESFLLFLAQGPWLGDSEPFALWLLGLIEAHSCLWGEAEAHGLRSRAIQLLALDSPRSVTAPISEPRARALRQRLNEEMPPEEATRLRDEIARSELSRRQFQAAFEVLEPNLAFAPKSSLDAAVDLFIASRVDEGGRARALSRLARSLPGPARAEALAVLALSAAVELDGPRALRFAEEALEIDPAAERAVVAMAEVSLTFPSLVQPHVIEASLSATVATAQSCLLLARTAEERGSLTLGLTWAEHARSLRPADPDTHREVLRLGARVGDARRLADAIDTGVRAFLPHDRLAEGLEAALYALSELDPDQTAFAAKSVLTHAGHIDALRRAVVDVAEKTRAPLLLANAIDLVLAQKGAQEISALLPKLAEARAQAGDQAAALRAWFRWISEHGGDAELPPFHEDVEKPGLAGSDAELYRAEIEVLVGRKRGTLRGEELFRLAVLRWDLAKDADGAFDALSVGAKLIREDGHGLMFHYLLRLAGPAKAAELLEARGFKEDDRVHAGTLLGLASRASLLIGERARAFRLAQSALERDSHQSEILAIAERTLGTGDLEPLEVLYDHVANDSFGRFGERAVRYRAARLLERRAGIEVAFRHARLAFEAVPDEGVTFVLFTRIAGALEKTDVLADTIDSSLQRVRDPRTRERLRLKSEALRGQGKKPGLEQAEALFRAAALSFEPELGLELERVLTSLLTGPEDERAEWTPWIQERGKDLLISLNGPDRSKAAIILARTALRHFSDTHFAFFCLGRAASGSLGEDEYQSLLQFKDRLGAAHEPLLDLWARVNRTSETGEPLGREFAVLLTESLLSAGSLSEGAEVLARAASDAPDDVSLSQRARDLAERSGRVDLVPAIEGLLPAPLWVRSILDRIDTLTDEEAVSSLVEIDLANAPIDLRIEALEAVARREERLARYADARDTWQELRALAPGSAAALSGLERAADRDDDHEGLLEILTQRAHIASDPDAERTIHLRRAAVLETHLGRPLEARELLEGVLQRQGDSWSVLRLLADSFERTSEHARAAELWSRAQAVGTDVEAAADACFRAARAYFEAGDPWRAHESLRYVDMGRIDCVELSLKVHRALGDHAAVMDALTVAARMKRDDRDFVALAFLEAAEIALKLEAPDIAEAHARDAIRLGNDSPEARLLLAQLIARRVGLLDRPVAEEIHLLLRGTEALRSARHRELRAYLAALVEERLRGGEACRAELRSAIESQGPRPLLAAGLARRLDDDPEQALGLYETAVGGEFGGLLAKGDILLEAALLARDTGQFSRAQAFLSALPEADPKRSKAVELLDEIQSTRSRIEERDSKNWRVWVAGGSAETSAQERARALEEAREAEALARSQATREELVFPSEALPVSRPSSERRMPSSDASALEVAEESELVNAFEAGDLSSGQALFDIYMSDRARSRDAVLVATHLVATAPWDADALGCLAMAASRDGSDAVALACRHVLGSFGDVEPVPAPNLALLAGQSDAAHAVVWRGAMTASAEALRIVWEHAGGFFRRDLLDYEIARDAKVTASDPGVLAETYRGASRVLGSRAALFARPGGEDIAISVLLTQPPAILIDGDLDSVGHEFQFHLGAMLMATAPEFALLLGSSTEEVQLLLEAIGQAFGPSARSSTQDARVVELAARLWEVIPARAQRRLTQLCAEPGSMDLEVAFANARIVLRRAGLLVSGDIRTAIDDICAGSDRLGPTDWVELAELAREYPEIVDLLALSVSLEYAEIRFRVAQGI